MSLAIHTQQTFDYVLVNDRKKPAAEQRTLVFHYLSSRDYLKVEKAFDASYAAATIGDSIAKAVDGIRVALVGWRGFEQAYDPAELDAVLTLADVGEVRGELLVAMTASEMDLKKSVSGLPSISDNSALPTAAADA